MKIRMFIILFTFLSRAAFSVESGKLLIRGPIERRISLVVTPEAIASALDLTTTQSDLKVATLNERSNSKTGYIVSVTSANLGKMKMLDGAEVFSYTMKLDGAPVGLSTSTGSIFTRSTTATPVNINRNVTISYNGKAIENMTEGIYSDTVTFNIAAR